MAHIPNYIVNEKAVSNRNACYGWAAVAVFFSFGAFVSDSPGAGLIIGLVGFVLICIGANIKTRKNLQGGGGIYR